MNDRVPIRRLTSGVPGFDEVLGGGIPEFSFNLVAGGPGCGKTTLGHQIMFANASPERKAVYFSIIGEPPIKMLRYQQQYSFFDAAKIGDGSGGSGSQLLSEGFFAGVGLQSRKCHHSGRSGGGDGSGSTSGSRLSFFQPPWTASGTAMIVASSSGNAACIPVRRRGRGERY